MHRKQSKTSTTPSLMLPKHLICCKLTSILCSPIVVNQYQRLIKPAFPLISLMSIKPWGAQGKNAFIRHDLISEHSVELCSHNTLTTHNDLRLRPLLHAHPIWPHLLWDHLLPRYAYHPIALDKHAPFHICDVAPIHHLVNHHLLHENWSLPKMDSLGKADPSPYILHSPASRHLMYFISAL